MSALPSDADAIDPELEAATASFCETTSPRFVDASIAEIDQPAGPDDECHRVSSALGGRAGYDRARHAALRAHCEAAVAAVAANERLGKYALDATSQIFAAATTDAMRAACARLRARLVAESACYREHAEARAYCASFVNLRRFCFDAGGDADKAFVKLNETLELRQRVRPWAIDVDARAMATGAVQLRGPDAFGRPVLVLDLARAPKEVTSQQLLQLIYAHFEHLRVRVARAGGVEKWALVFNVERLTIWNMPSMSTIIEIFKALMSSFPEFSGNTILWQPPTAFKAVWYAVRPFMEADTLKKTVFVSGDTTVGSSKADAQMTAMLGAHWRQVADVDHARGRAAVQWDAERYAQEFAEAQRTVVAAAVLHDPCADYPEDA